MKKLLFTLTCLFAGLLLVADPVEDLLSTTGSADDYPGSNFLTVFDSTKVEVQETGLGYFYTHQLFKILNKQGALEKRVIEYGYDPLSAFVEIRMVKIYRKNGSIEELDLSEVKDYPAPARAIYWGARERMIEVGRLEPGDALEVKLFKKGFTYALLMEENEDKYIPPMRGHFYDIVEFWSNQHVINKTYTVNMPAEKPMQFEFYHGECRSSMRFEGDRTIYTFTKSNIEPFKGEPNMTATSDVAPKLLLSTSPDWEAKSLWFYGVNEDYNAFDPTEEVKAFVDELLKDAKTEMDSVSILTHWVADNMRYSGISMGPGEGYTLHNAEMNFTDRCGVCKDKASLLVAFLRAAEFESYPAMTMAGSRIEDIPADQFNHSVTVVKLSDGKYHLLDPTWVPFVRELWSSAEQQQNFLMGIPEGADLGITEISEPENHYLKITGNSIIDAAGTLEGEIYLTAEGQTDAAIRGMFTREYKSEWGKNLEAEFLRVNPKAEIISMDFGENPYNHMAGPIEIKVKYRIPGFAFVGENNIIFVPFVADNVFARGMSHLYLNTKPDERLYGFRDRCSRLVNLKETITVPDGYSMINENLNLDLDGEAAAYSGILSQTGNVIEMEQEIILEKRIYEPGDWPEVKKVVKAQNEMAHSPVILYK
ncbi:MAG: DUF3857 domain-containing protein [Bacteroidales bacterium]|nr:DUF3857 domain-containing protein [Bacteroidales bacterium]